MSQIGICEYVIGTPHYHETWFYCGRRNRFSEKLADAQRYDDLDVLRGELDEIACGASLRILEIQRCPKCKKEFVEHPAISRVDNKTEICPECGVAEAVDAFCAHEERARKSAR